MLKILVIYEWKTLTREVYNLVLPISFFICSSILFLWIPQKISTEFQSIGIWISLFLSINIANKDVFLKQSKDGILTLWSSLNIPNIYVFWSKWVVISLVNIISFIPLFIFFNNLIKPNIEMYYNIYLLQLLFISIVTFNLINLSVECLFTGKMKRNSPLLAPIISIPLSIPTLLFSIDASTNQTYSSSFMLIISLLLFLFPILSWVSSNTMSNIRNKNKDSVFG
jgi:ABC-type transport system involved in cytochrome c biogenesis permease component